MKTNKEIKNTRKANQTVNKMSLLRTIIVKSIIVVVFTVALTGCDEETSYAKNSIPLYETNNTPRLNGHLNNWTREYRGDAVPVLIVTF